MTNSLTMKKVGMILLLLMSLSVFAQDDTSRISDPKQTVELFFEAMHRQDTATMRSLTFGNITLRSIGKNEIGETKITSESFDEFLKTLANLPETTTIQEKILLYEVKIDGEMAHVWTPYSFFVNGKLTHCGANSFQLFKEKGNWKIISIMDSRRKNCNKEN